MSLGIGGAETHITELALALLARGDNVFIASGGGVYEKRLTEAGAVCVKMPLYSKLPFDMVKSYRRLSALIKKEKFDIVHAHARIPAFICGLLQRKYGFRFVTTAHYDFRVTPLLRKITDWGEHCFAVSEDIALYVRRTYDYPQENITVVPNGIDTDYFTPRVKTGKIRRELEILSDARVILHVSRLESYSSLCALELIRAMKTVGEKHPDTVLLIVGGGAEYENVRSAAAEVNSALGRAAVVAVGARDDVCDFICDSDFFAGPSRAAMEAMSCGLPTLISGSQGHIGIFSDAVRENAEKTNFCGRGLKLPDADILSAGLCELLEMPEEKLRLLGEHNRNYIIENYSARKMTDIYTSVYEKYTKIKTGKNHDYTICGYYGFGNTGDESLAGCIIGSLRQKSPSADICVMSHAPEKTSRRFAVSSVDRMNIVSVTETLRHTKTFIFGGGNLLQDKTSTASLVYYTKMIALAKKCGCEIEILANGLGPISKEKNRRRTAAALSLADRISMRENYSLVLCKELCPTSEPVLVPDPASEIKAAYGGLSRLGLKFENYFVVAPKTVEGKPAGELAEAIKTISEKTGLEPLYIAMHEKQDTPLCLRLCDEAGGRLISEKLEADEIAELLSGAEFSICSRLHTLIYSVTAGCLCAVYTDDVKLTSYASLVGEGRASVCESGFDLIHFAEKHK